MNEILTPDEIVSTAETHGLSPQQLCERAGVAYTVLWRWRKGRDIKLTSYLALLRAAIGADTPTDAHARENPNG